ncbi:MAG: tRNA lysidine(34) synthetase TilS [Sulfurospirillaceae bacterium]|nr:tRNA lysidine(34) synthetase TilS [Sulfurospirillaceae bacterium]
MQPLPSLHESTLEALKNSTNLLAFSGGGDSTALFFLLLEHNIAFDIAIVNYHTRAQSNEEVAYARTLAKKYHKHCFVYDCHLSLANFEHHARKERYSFFEKLIHEHHYTTLLSAHHLNDKLEWFLMQLSRGAGLVEMIGMSEREQREDYVMVRPLLHISKASLQHFLQMRNITYFHDESNDKTYYARNHIRAHYANAFIDEFALGVSKSFEYLQNDALRLLPLQIVRIKNLFIITRHNDDLFNIRHIDKVLKQLGTLVSQAQRDEILRTKECVVGGVISVCFTDKSIFIAPYCHTVMTKAFKEACRNARIPSKIRPYMYQESIAPCEVLLLHSDHIL